MSSSWLTPTTGEGSKESEIETPSDSSPAGPPESPGSSDPAALLRPEATPGILLPRDGAHDTRELDALKRAGLA